MSGLTGHAQWLTQTNVIPPGWSAVYFYVDGSSRDLSQLITNNPANPIDQIWLWKYPSGNAQYISSPDSPLSGGGQWLSWYLNPSNSASTLSALIPNAACLIHSSAATNFIWKVQGQPTPPSYVWDLTGLNFVGFPTPYATPPSFQNYFAQDPAISSIVQFYAYMGGAFSTLNPQFVFAQATTRVVRGQAYWVSATNVNNTYFGPFNITLPNPTGLNYGASAGQFTLHLVNVTTNTLTVSARLLPSETPPAGQTNITGVPPLLVEGALNSSNLTYAYTTLPVGGTASWTLAPAGKSGSDVAVVLGLNRFALTNTPGSLYAGFLQFSDSLGFSEVDVPVSANAVNNAGLWVGHASLSQVGSYLKSYATNADGTFMQVPVLSQTFVTNFPSAFVTTNLVLANTLTTNFVLSYYNQTNLVVNTYITNGVSIITNGLVTATNLVINTFTLTNLTITTTVTNFYLSSSNTIVWQTSSATNATGSAYALTNFNAVINTIGSVRSNNTPVLVTNLAVNYLVLTNVVTTNGPFLSPVTTLTIINQTVSSTFLTTNLAYNVMTTNLSFITNSSSFLQVTNYGVTNVFSSASATTNYVATNSALAVITNGAVEIVIYSQKNSYLVYRQLQTNYFTNFFAITNSYNVTAGITNLLGSTTNQSIVSVNLGTPSTAVTNYTLSLLAVATNATYAVITNTQFGSYSNYVVSALNTNLGAVLTPYPLRLIIFNDGTNAALLQRVYYGLRQNTNIVVSTTESVLDVAHLNSARRISCTSMPWTAANTPWAFSGQLVLGGTLTTTVTDTYDDQAANPFLHTYHPDHNNLDLTQNPPKELPAGSQSYALSRTITLTVAPNTRDFISLTTGNSSLAGVYQETTTLTGLGGATRTFTSAGGFSITRISPISVLTTQ